MRINRGTRRLALMTGVEPPSAEDLQKRLEKRIFFVDAATEIGKRYNSSPDIRGVQLEKRFTRSASKLRPKRQAEPVTPADSPNAPNSLGLDIE
jgi:hypothetical protein